MATLLHTNTELVAGAWLADLPGLSASMVGPRLPRPSADGKISWPDGFIAYTTVGGSPDMYQPLASPVLQLDCWATTPNSSKPPFGKANQLAEIVRWAVLERTNFGELLSMHPVGYAQARVKSAYLLQEPRPVYSDPGDYACYRFMLALLWIEVTRP